MLLQICFIITTIFVRNSYSSYDYDRPQIHYSQGQNQKMNLAYQTANKQPAIMYYDVREDTIPTQVSESFNKPQQIYLTESEQNYPVYEVELERQYPIIMKAMNVKRPYSTPVFSEEYNPLVGETRSHKHKPESWFYSSPNWNMNNAANTNILRAADPRYIKSYTHFVKIQKPIFDGYASKHYAGTNHHKNTHINVYNRNAQSTNNEETMIPTFTQQ